MDGDALLGYAFFVRKGHNCLFDYLAIAEEYRGKGLGTAFLKQLRNCFSEADCVIGEVEDPDYAKEENDKVLRERRLQFYLRLGYRQTGVTSRVFGVDYLVLEVPTGFTHSTEVVRKTYTDLYRDMLPEFVFRTQFMVKG